MNAVEAVEQLGTLGRKLQAHELGLQQPVRALRQSADWEKVLGDPVTALAQLFGAAGGGQAWTKEPEGAPEAPVSPLPLAPFRWEEHHLPAGSGIHAGQGGFSDSQGGDRGPRSGRAGGMRLARRQTSLLGILNANLEDRPYAGPGELRPQGRPERQGDVRPDPSPAVQDELSVDPREPVARWGPVPSSSVGQDEVAQLSGSSQQDTPDYRGSWPDMVSDRPGDGPSAAAGAAGASLPGDGDVAVGMNAWGYESLLPHGQEGVHSEGRLNPERRRAPANGTASGMPAVHGEESNQTQASASPLVPQSQARPDGQAGDWNGWQQNAGLAALQDGVWAAANASQGERPLSMAQIDQVLAALDERLELMLLRMYGASGGLA